MGLSSLYKLNFGDDLSMKLFEAISPLLNEKQQEELQQIWIDYPTLGIDYFFKKYRKILFNHWEKEDYNLFRKDCIDNGELFTKNTLTIMYLSKIKCVKNVDWSGEEQAGEIKRFLHLRLKHYGYLHMNLNDKIPKKKLKNGELKRGEYVPLLMRCFEEQVAAVGLKVVSLDLGHDEYNIALVPETWFEKMENVEVEGYLEISDTTIWELSILQIGDKRTTIMSLLKKRFDVPLSEIKDFIIDLPIVLGKGSKKEMLKLKIQYEQVGCTMQLMECMEYRNQLNDTKDNENSVNARQFEKGTKPKEIFIYTCERIAEPLLALGFKYRKSRNDIIKKDDLFTYRIYFQPSRYGSTQFWMHVEVESDILFKWREQYSDIKNGVVVNTTLASLSKRDNYFPRYDVSSLISRENTIGEIHGLIQGFALPFFDRFKNIKLLMEEVEREGSFLPHRMAKWEKKEHQIGIHHDFIKCFSEIY